MLLHQQVLVNATRRHCVPALFLIGLLLGLGGCASPSYIALLPDADGTVGKVTVSNAHGATVLEQANQGTLLGGTPGQTFTVDRARLQQDFGAALAASPQAPRVFVLYFETGGATLTPESNAALADILREIQGRPGADVSVVGHTDTAGAALANFELGLKRAQIVAELIGPAQLATQRLSVESHGDRNLSIPTPAQTSEPRNRRVEVTVR